MAEIVEEEKPSSIDDYEEFKRILKEGKEAIDSQTKDTVIKQ